jgi:ribosomal protein S27E
VLGPASLVLYDCSTLYFETDEEDGFRESGFSKERRLEPQITIGLLTDATGFPLMEAAFEGNKAETKTMLPVIGSFLAAHHLPDVTVVTVVADAGTVSEANQKAIEAPGLSFILGAKIPHEPYAVKQWRREHPGEPIPNGYIFTQPWPAGPDGGRRDQVIYYQYQAGRARRALRGTGYGGPGWRAGPARPSWPAGRWLRVRCPQCERESPDEARFCSHCGGQLAVTCVACGAVQPPKARFCPECGRAAAAAPVPAGYTPRISASRYWPCEARSRVNASKSACCSATSCDQAP